MVIKIKIIIVTADKLIVLFNVKKVEDTIEGIINKITNTAKVIKAAFIPNLPLRPDTKIAIAFGESPIAIKINIAPKEVTINSTSDISSNVRYKPPPNSKAKTPVTPDTRLQNEVDLIKLNKIEK
mgnify:CR=1 FL=1